MALACACAGVYACHPRRQSSCDLPLLIKKPRPLKHFSSAKTHSSTFPVSGIVIWDVAFSTHSMSQSTRPVLGYLTTLWTPPASCLTVEVYQTTPPWQIGYQGVTCSASGGFYDATDCWPPRTANAPNPTGAFLSGWGFYSPGTLCPSGFTTACIATYGQDVSGWLLQFPLTTGETAVGCCPR